MEYQTLLYERKGAVMTVTFNNPDKLNALTSDFIGEFTDLLEKAAADDGLKIIIVTGSGKAFIAGADIALMSRMQPEEAAKYAYNTTEMYRKMEAMDKIFIAAINGFALGGGCEFTLACDLRIASTKALMGCPEVGLGIIPGGGGTQRLPRLIGMAKAKELVYTGKSIKADEAYRIGLVNEVAEPEELLAKAEEMAANILKNSGYAVKIGKEAFNNGIQMDITSAMNYEKNLFALCFAAEDQKEGMQAFLEKRKAVFK